MRYFLLALVLSFGLSLPAAAQEGDLDTFIKHQRDAAQALEGILNAPDSRKGKLDWLFGELAKTKDPETAKRIAAQITVIFSDSGSETINLLMARANKAVNDKKNELALDLLDQVITLKPDYAEGWNKRATVYFNAEKYGQALADIEHVLRLEPRHFGALSGLAMVLGQFDDNKRAIQVFEMVLTLYPQLETAQKALAEAKKELRERDI